MGRTSEQAQAANRARLLAAAAAAFAAEGLDAANINDISLAAGLAKGTVYNYFPSKEALFLAVIEEACRLAAARADGVAARASIAERLRAAIAADIAWAREHEAFARVLVRELFTGKPELYARVIEAGAPYIEHVGEILREGIERTEVRSDRGIEPLALVFTGLGLLALVQHWGSGGTWPALDEIPDLVVDVFLEGARPRPTKSPSLPRSSPQTRHSRGRGANNGR